MAIEYIKTLDALYKTMAGGGEIIVWVNATPGTSVMNLFRYTERKNVCCSVRENPSQFNNFLCGVPVIHLALMPHFKDTATFIVAAPTSRNELFYNKLANYGCKKIFCLTEDVHKAVQSELKRLKDSGETTLWQMKYLMNKMKRMEHLINMQHEICKVNTASFEPYRNCFRGKKVVIVNDGSTAKYYKPIPDAIHIAVEGMWRTRTDIPFDFVFTHNSGEGGRNLEASLSKIRNKVFVGKFVAIDGGSYSEYMSTIGDKIARYFIGDNTFDQLIYRDITCHALTDFWGAYSAAIQFAQFTFPDEIYLVGCDVVPNEGYSALKKTGYARLKMLGQRSYPGTKIISINPIGLKGLFQDEYTVEYKASLEANKPKSEPQPVVETKPPAEVKPVETKSPAETNFKFPPVKESGDGILWTITEQVAK